MNVTASRASGHAMPRGRRRWRGEWRRRTQRYQGDARPAPRLGSLGSRGLGAAERGSHGRSGCERLIHDAVALGELLQQRKLFLVGVRIQVEREPDLGEPYGRLTIDAERAAEVQLPLGAYASRRDRDLERGRDRL